MNDLTLFDYKGHDVRVILDKKRDPWWVAVDACSILDYSDTEVALRKLDDDEKLIRKIYVSGQNREMWTINEPGLYTLILRSNKPEAKKIKRWITHEVLPSIRKTGSYSRPGAEAEMDERIRRLDALAKVATRAARVAKAACYTRAERCAMVNEIILNETGRDLRAEFPGIVPAAPADFGGVSEWLAERVDVGADYWVSTVEVYMDYRQWAAASGHPALGRNIFYQQLHRILPVSRWQRGSRRRMSFTGMQLKPKPLVE